MPFKIVRNDITKVKADVIVNTANPNPICVSGTDLAIYEAAGKEQLLAERTGIGKIARGDIAVTGAYNLKAKYIIHTVGPVWTDGKHQEFEILESCYRKSLQKALNLQCTSIAFPLISTGVYGFPKDKALHDGHINVKVEFGEGEGKLPLDNIAKRAEEYKPKERVTYKMIKEYIEAKYGFKVHTAYIAEVKRDLGLPMYDAPNAVEELKQPRKHPTPEKVEAIKDALKHFEII